MALLALQRREPRSARWAGHLFWTGDSRVYVVEPETGAHQVTRDDLRDWGDAMLNLRQDSVVSNAISADTDFVVHHHQVEVVHYGWPAVDLQRRGLFGSSPSRRADLSAAGRGSERPRRWAPSRRLAI